MQNELKKIDYRDWLEATRPWSFIMTAISVLAGSILALNQAGRFNPVLAILTLTGIVAAHAATNLMNDYFDTLYGVDRPGAPTTQYRHHPVLDGVFTPRGVVVFSAALYLIAAGIGVYLYFLRGWAIGVIAVAGGIISITYTAGPLSLKYRGLGEIFVFLTWGPFMTLGAYFVQTGSWVGWWTVLWVSAPLGLWVALVLLANNLKDLSYDSQTGIVTTAIRLGRKRGLKLFSALVFSAYFLAVLGILQGHFSAWVVIVFLSLPLTLKLLRNFQEMQELPADADPQTARVSAVFGMLLIISLII